MFTLALGSIVSLILQFKLLLYAVKLMLFMAIYLSFKSVMENAIQMVMSRIDNLEFPCMFAYILNELDVFSMLNFGLSFYAMIYVGKFFYNGLAKII